jgi:hypothetical protein
MSAYVAPLASRTASGGKVAFLPSTETVWNSLLRYRMLSPLRTRIDRGKN